MAPITGAPAWMRVRVTSRPSSSKYPPSFATHCVAWLAAVVVYAEAMLSLVAGAVGVAPAGAVALGAQAMATSPAATRSGRHEERTQSQFRSPGGVRSQLHAPSQPPGSESRARTAAVHRLPERGLVVEPPLRLWIGP